MDNFDNNNNPLQDNMGGYGGLQPQKSDLSKISMVFGILAIVFGCCSCFGFIAGIVAIITGIISLKNMTPNKGKATAGIIMGCVSFLICLISFIIRSIIDFPTAFVGDFMESFNSCIRFF